ncbi:hypothetical protein T11_11008, partial [Trichinella zimbabwensis]
LINMDRKGRRNQNSNPMSIILCILKAFLLISACVTISLAEKYYGDYQVGIIIGIAAITILYCCVSFILDIAIQCKCREQRRCCVVAELIFSSGGFCGWLISLGTAITISLRTGSRTTQLFGWIGVCCGIEVALFIALIAIYLTQWVGYYIRRR